MPLWLFADREQGRLERRLWGNDAADLGALYAHFREAGCTKYALEALRQSFQMQTLSPHLVHQITWHRFVNIRGGLATTYHVICNMSTSTSSSNPYTGIQPHRAVTSKGSSLCLSSQCHLQALMLQLMSLLLQSAHSTKSDLLDIGKVASVVYSRT